MTSSSGSDSCNPSSLGGREDLLRTGSAPRESSDGYTDGTASRQSGHHHQRRDGAAPPAENCPAPVRRNEHLLLGVERSARLERRVLLERRPDFALDLVINLGIEGESWRPRVPSFFAQVFELRRCPSEDTLSGGGHHFSCGALTLEVLPAETIPRELPETYLSAIRV
jgi:hypothetical protein